MTKEKYHIVHTESSGGWGGQEIRILNEIKTFLEKDYPVTLICDKGSPIANRAKEYNIPTVELRFGKKTLKGLWDITCWIINNNFDIINTHSSSDSWMVAIGMRLAFKKRPLVRTRHVSAPVSNNRATQWLYQKASDYIVTTGERLRDTLIRDNRIDANKITSVPTGIDCNLFTPTDNKSEIRTQLNLPDDKIIIGIVATLRSWKGHAYLIDAIAQLNQHNLHLLIVGNGPQWENINQQIDRLNLRHSVTLCGDQKNVIPWLQAMDIFVLPSYANEGVPQSLMQAMACSLPVISTDVGSITEIIDNKETGLIISTKNVDDISKHILLLLENNILKEHITKNGLLAAHSRFCLETMHKKMEKIFSGVINEN